MTPTLAAVFVLILLVIAGGMLYLNDSDEDDFTGLGG